MFHKMRSKIGGAKDVLGYCRGSQLNNYYLQVLIYLNSLKLKTHDFPFDNIPESETK